MTDKLAAILLLSCLLAPSVALAGRMPTQIDRVESARADYVKLIPLDAQFKDEYHLIQVWDVKRLVGGETARGCYMFYFNGLELVKLPIKHQSCNDVLTEIEKSKG